MSKEDKVGDVHVDTVIVRGLALPQDRAQAGVVQALKRRGRQAVGRGRERRDVLLLDSARTPRRLSKLRVRLR